MKLTYRGTQYDFTPTQVELETTETKGIYRGLEWRFRKPKKNAVQQPSLKLMYRGVAYQTGNVETEEVVPQKAIASETEGFSVQGLARALMVGRKKKSKLREQSLLVRDFS